MNFKQIYINYRERFISSTLNFVPLKYHSAAILRPFIHPLSRNYWARSVDNPNCPNYYKKYYLDRESECRRLLDIVESRLKRKPSSFFEVGCNVGSNLMAIAKIYKFDKNISYHGCDINGLSIENARKNDYGGAADFFTADITDIRSLKKFSDNRFDLVFSRDVFMFIEPGKLKARIIRELIRISGGCLILMEPWYGTDRALFISSHLIYYEDMRKYLPKDEVAVEDIKGFDNQVLMVSHKNSQHH